jgi:hypothetical protein
MLSRLIALVLLAAAPAAAQSPIAGMPVAGPRTQVLTIGSVHLSGFKQWTPDMLEPLLSKLAAFRPDIITQEGVSGEQCAHMRAFPDLYAESYDGYCWDPDEVIGITKLSVPEAMRAIDRALADWPTNPTASQRRQLATWFLAAGDRASARVQWLRLPAAERHAGDGLNDELVEIIERKGKPMNESYDVAAVLAARLGLERVYAVDDHTSDGALAHVGKGYETAMMKRFEAARANPALKQYEAQSAAVKNAASMLTLYRQLNARDGVKGTIRADFGGAMGDPTPELSGRQYLGWWEVRNMRMVANIRSTFASRPGARVLNIVGSAHKPWYDRLLSQMADVEVVDAQAVLR